MDGFFTVVCSYSEQAYWILFWLLLLTGFNIPISEDLLLILAGMIASICVPDQVYSLFGWIYAGCILSAWEAYWIGRLFGPKLYSVKWFSRILPPERIEKLHVYYEKFGILTFIVGRFCPGGVRNALFLSSGLGKMPFDKFVLRDSFACLISCTTLYALGYMFAENHDLIFHYLKRYDEIFIALIVIAILLVSYLIWRQKHSTPV